jgi:hypothetical protein
MVAQIKPTTFYEETQLTTATEYKPSYLGTITGFAATHCEDVFNAHQRDLFRLHKAACKILSPIPKRYPFMVKRRIRQKAHTWKVIKKTSGARISYQNDYERIRLCHKTIRGREPELKRNPVSQKYYISNLYRCDLKWVCPLCAESDAKKCRWLVWNKSQAWRKSGGTILLATYTLAHKGTFEETFNTLTKAFRALTAHRQYKKFRRDATIKDSIRTMEITFSGVGTFHPHLHVSYFLDRYVSEDQLKIFEADLLSAWTVVLKASGGECNETGVVLTRGSPIYTFKDIAYRHSSRKADSVWKLLDQAWNGNKEAVKSFIEYAEVTRGHPKTYGLPNNRLSNSKQKSLRNRELDTFTKRTKQ